MVAASMGAMGFAVIILIVGQLYPVSAFDTTLVYAPTDLVLSNPNNQRNNWMYSMTDTSPHWQFGMPTKLIHLMKHRDIYLDIDTKHAVEDDTRLYFDYICDVPSSRKGTPDPQSPFEIRNPDNKPVVLCYSPFRLTVHADKSLLIDSPDDPYTKTLSVVKRLRIESDPIVTLDNVFRHSMKIYLHLRGSLWTKYARPLYIRNWDSVFQFGKTAAPGESTIKWFLTTDALSAMKESTSGGPGTTTVPFLNDLIVLAITRASEFVKTSISIGAVLLFNAASCGDIRSNNSIAFMTDSYADHENFPDTVKVLRLDPLTGILTYSRHGLSELKKKVHMETKATSKVTCSGTDCSRIHICATLQYTPLGRSFPYSHTEQSLTADISHSSTVQPQSSCHKLPQKTDPKIVNVFARAAVTFIICPIICDRITETFQFYKGGILMKPETGRAFTRFGGLEVHQSGVMLRVTESASHLDSGEYSCTAGGQEAKLQVHVLGLPTFHIPGTSLERGYLPSRIYAMEGDGFTVNCTVFHSGLKNIDLKAEFNFVNYAHYRDKNAWFSRELPDFNRAMARAGTTAIWLVEKSYTHTYTTATYSMHSLPVRNDNCPFNHRVTCRATADAGELNKVGFEIPEYDADSAADVISVQRLSVGHLSPSIDPCCLSSCTGSNVCQVQYTLEPKMMKKFKAADIKVRAAFRISYSNLPREYESMVTFEEKTGKLLWKGTKGMKDMTDEEKFDFVSLVPVFFFFFPVDDDGLWPKVSILRRPGTTFIGAMTCSGHPLCLYTTDNDKDLVEELKVNTRFKTGVTVPESHRYVRIPEKLNLPNVPEIPPRWSATAFATPPPASDRTVNGTDISNALDALKEAKESKVGTIGVRASVELVLTSVICLSVLMI